MRLQEFLDGKISVKAESKQDAERFLKSLAKEGVKWADGHPANHSSKPCGGVCYQVGYLGGKELTYSSVMGDAEKHPLPGRPYKLITVKEFFEGTNSVIERLLRGEVVVHIKSRKDAENALKEIHALGKRGSNAVEKGFHSIPCWYFWEKYDQEVYFADEHDNHDILFRGSPIIEYSAQSKTSNEQIVIFRDKDGSVKCVHKLDGKVVGSASVTKYYKDADDLRVAAKYALEKLGGKKSLPPFDADGKPNYNVGQKVKINPCVSAACAYYATIVDVDSNKRNFMIYKICDARGNKRWVFNTDVIGLAD